MLLVGQRVDDVQARRRGGELLEHVLRERADDDGVDPALEVARDVGHRLAAAERHVRLQRDDVRRRARGWRSRRSSACAATASRTAARRGGRRARRPSARAARARARASRARPASRQRSSSAGVEVEDRQEVLAACRRLGHCDPSAVRGAQVRYSALIRTYSALRSHVHTVDVARAGARGRPSTSMSVPFRYVGRLRRRFVVRPAVLEEHDRRRSCTAARVEVERRRRRGPATAIEAAPVRIAAVDGGLHERRVGDRLARPAAPRRSSRRRSRAP